MNEAETRAELIDPQIKKIVVENSSNEQFIKNLQKKYDNLKCYLTGQNLGMGPGNNFGIKKAKTNFVMILRGLIGSVE